MRVALTTAAALGAVAGPSRAEPPAPGGFLAVSIGGAGQGEQPPGLVGASPGLVGHIEGGWTDGRFVGGGLSLGMTRTGYDNMLAPPEGIVPDDELRLTRVSVGAVGEGRLPLGPISAIAGACLHADRISATARGSLYGIVGDYFTESDIGFGVDVRAGLDVHVHRTTWIGLRGGWTWFRTDVEGVTSGAEWLGGPSIEVRITFDMSGFRMGVDPRAGAVAATSSRRPSR